MLSLQSLTTRLNLLYQWRLLYPFLSPKIRQFPGSSTSDRGDQVLQGQDTQGILPHSARGTRRHHQEQLEALPQADLPTDRCEFCTLFTTDNLRSNL